jgi:hypothetical protein
VPRRRVALALLACSLIASTGLRVVAGAEKRGLTHDEAITYLATACHQGEYARLTTAGAPPLGRWVPAAEWKVMLRPDRFLCLGTIARDLAHEDVHPPLYFWLLHGWVLVFGVGVWAGPSLNVVLAALTCFALFGLARRALGDPVRAAFVASVWSFSPAAIRVFAEARQYELLALVTVLFAWACVRVAFPPTRRPRRDLPALALATAAGALTQFLFGLVAVVGTALVVAGLWRSRRRLLPPALLAIVAGYALFGVLHPSFPVSLARGRAQASDPEPELLSGRLEATVRTLAEFLMPPVAAAGVPALLALAVLVAATSWSCLRSGRDPVAALPRGAMPLLFVWLALAHAALYLVFVSPGSAMDAKHLSAVWPFAAFVPVLVFERLPRRARAAAAVPFAVALVGAGTVAALDAPHGADGRPAALERARGVVLDNVARGVLPRVVWRVPDRAPVLAADQRRLLAQPEIWTSELRIGYLLVGGVPASDPRYGNSPALGRRVAAEIARRRELAPVPDPLEPGHVFRVGHARERAGRRGWAGDDARAGASDRPDGRPAPGGR